MFGPLVVLRAYQQRHVAALLQDYLELPTETLTLNPASLSDGRVLLRPNELSQSTESSVRAEYLVADIGRDECTVHELPVTFRYTTMSGYTDLSQQIRRSGARSLAFRLGFFSPSTIRMEDISLAWRCHRPIAVCESAAAGD